MKPRVLILSASVGKGHVRAASALQIAFEQLGKDLDIHNIDILEHTNKLFKKIYSDFYFKMADIAPHLLGMFYDRFDKPWKNHWLRLSLEKFFARKFIALVKEYQPDLTICTHFLPAELISSMIDKGDLRTRFVIVPTDMDVHSIWLYKHYDKYFVSRQETKAYLCSLGIDEKKIHATGIPIDPVFAQFKNKQQMRLKHGLDADLPTILISAGGFGITPVEKIIEALSKMHTRSQVAAFYGRNNRLADRVKRSIAQLPSDCKVKFIPVPFTTEMDEFMSAADLIIGKPGGLTTSEALAKELAFVIFNPIPGQEEHNSYHLLENGAALRCCHLETMPFKIDSLLNDTTRLEQMRHNTHTIAYPNSAAAIVSILMNNI